MCLSPITQEQSGDDPHHPASLTTACSPTLHGAPSMVTRDDGLLLNHVLPESPLRAACCARLPLQVATVEAIHPWLSLGASLLHLEGLAHDSIRARDKMRCSTRCGRCSNGVSSRCRRCSSGLSSRCRRCSSFHSVPLAIESSSALLRMFYQRNTTRGARGHCTLVAVKWEGNKESA